MAVVKTIKEVALITRACKITDAIFVKIVSDFSFKTEEELASYILKEIKKRGLRPSFPPIVAAHKNAAEPHHVPTKTPLRGFVVIDFGVVYKKYMSDMTRTIYVGKPNLQEKKMYALVLKAQEKGIQSVVPGKKCGTTDRIIRDFFGTKWEKYFIHTTGHGVGTRIHEAPKIFWKRMRSSFKENMVITVEPGLYVLGKWGIRIEDTCVITKKGCKVLTHASKKLIIKR